MRRTLALLLLVFAVSACRESGDPIRQTIDVVVEAAESRDTVELRRLLSDNYRDGMHGSPDDAVRTVRRYLAAYDHFTIQISDFVSNPGAGVGEASFRIDFVGTPRKVGGLDAYLPRTSAYDFNLKLVESEGKWKIESATWQEAAPITQR